MSLKHKDVLPIEGKGQSLCHPIPANDSMYRAPAPAAMKRARVKPWLRDQVVISGYKEPIGFAAQFTW